jgi:BASS family bile acid:Na+ symporter
MQTITGFVIPAAVFFLMLVVGLDLSVGDFRRLVQYPRTLIVGTLGQLVVMPLVAAASILTLHPSEVIVGGVILIAAAPGAPISNLLVYLARGNVALSVTFTAFTNVIGVVTLPLIATAGLLIFVDEPTDIRVPLRTMIGQLVLLMLLPIAIGMVVRQWKPHAIARHRATLKRVSLLTVAAVVAFIVVDQRAIFAEKLISAAGLSTLLTSFTMAFGFGLGWLIGAPFADRITLLVEFSARNTAIGIVVAATVLGRLDYSLFIVGYFVVQMVITMGVLAFLSAWSRERSRTMEQSIGRQE